jgi:hypothetical protein
LKTDITTQKNGSVIEASAPSWDTTKIRPRSAGTPTIEGDILAILPGQEGSFENYPGLYEISAVAAGQLTLLAVAPGSDPVTFVTTALDADLFPTGVGLRCSILRRETNPLVRGSDMASIVSTNSVTSASAAFVSNNVQVGDHLVIEDGSDAGEYIITNSLASAPFVEEGTLDLLNLDGSTPSFAGDTGRDFRVIRRRMQASVIGGAQTTVSGGTFLEVPDPNAATFPFDVFSPSMVGRRVDISGSDNALNDGVFNIIAYVHSGRVEIDNGAAVSDTAAQATIRIL